MNHIIWSDKDLDLDDWRDDILEEEENQDLSDDELAEIMYATNDSYLDDERLNLSEVVFSTPIVVIADLGLWDGHHSGMKEIKSGKVSDCLVRSCDTSTWYVNKNGDLVYEGIHHDGTNRYLYRAWKETTSETQKENFLQKVLDGTLCRRDITRLTKRVGDGIANVYGWRIPRLRTSAA